MGSERRRSPECAATSEMRRFRTFSRSLRNGKVRPKAALYDRAIEMTGSIGSGHPHIAVMSRICEFWHDRREAAGLCTAVMGTVPSPGMSERMPAHPH
jgi:hypothetical protein